MAASRSEDGKSDDDIQFVDTIKSLSAKQLHLHYVIYNCLNKLLVAGGQSVNVGLGNEIQRKNTWFSTVELIKLNLRLDTDLNILHRQGLLFQYAQNVHKLDEEQILPYVKVSPTTYGVLLYAIAHNQIKDWRSFSSKDFGDFEDISLPHYFAFPLRNC